TLDGRARARAARLTHGAYRAEIIALQSAATQRLRRMKRLYAALDGVSASRIPAGHGVHPCFHVVPVDGAARRGAQGRPCLGAATSSRS
ncbi:MAG: hypothetical protein ACREEE_19185, partial [Dongiaceae bacterium]